MSVSPVHLASRGAGGAVIAVMAAVVALVFCSSGFAADDIPAGKYHIASVVTAGTRNLYESAILTKVRSRAGELFDPEVAAADAKRIAEVKGVQYAYYNAELKDDQVTLTFVVIERLLVRGIWFQGNKKFSDSSLEKKLSFKQGDYLDNLMIEAGIKDMLQQYHEKGYAFAEITTDKNDMETGRVLFLVKEGPRVKVTQVNFSGNDQISSGHLRDVVAVKTRRLIFWQRHYEEKELKEDVDKLREVYLKKGFLDVKVRSGVEFAPDNSWVHVTYYIEEGPVYHVGKLDIKGGDFFTYEELTQDLKLKPGEICTPQGAEFDKKKVVGMFLAAGFIDVRVDQTRTFTAGAIADIHYDIKPGERYKIGFVTITGNEQTQDKVVRRILDERDFSPGQWYNARDAEGSGQGALEKQINAQALTQSAVITPVGDKPETRDAQVSLTEGQTGMVMVGAGVSTDSGLVGQVVFEQRNFDIGNWPSSFGDFVSGKGFKGAGQIFRISLEPGTEYSQYGVTFTEPYLNDKPISMTVGSNRYVRGFDDYDELRTKGFIDFDKRYKSGWHAGVGFRVEQVKIDEIDSGAPKQIWDFEGSNMVYGVRPHIGYDTTDDRYYPTKGYSFNAGYEQCTGVETFGTVDSSIRWYKTVAEDFFERKTVLATKVQGGMTAANAPFFEKFYAGGTGSMRGFEYQGISPRAGEDETAIGSDWIFLANSELAVPLNSDVFSALFFVDSGTVQTGPYRVAAGTGLQIMVPQILGPVPMRFEFAVPLQKGDQDKTRVFSFSITRLF